MIDVIGDDCATSRDLATYKLRGNHFWRISAEALAVVLTHVSQLMLLLRLANGDILHLRGDNTAARVVHLRDIADFALTTFCAARLIDMGKA